MADAIILHNVDNDKVLVASLTNVVRTMLNEGRYLDAMHLIACIRACGTR